MLSRQLHPDPDPTQGGHAPGGCSGPGEGLCGGGEGAPGGRLNLLLSYAGWRDDSWADRLPRLLEPMGVRSHRAATAREATRVIETIPIHIAVVDLALPMGAPTDRDEEAGPRLLELLARTATRPPTVVVKRARTIRDDRRELTAALRAGAFAVIDRPDEPRDLETMLDVLRRVLTRYYRGRWPGALS